MSRLMFKMEKGICSKCVVSKLWEDDPVKKEISSIHINTCDWKQTSDR